MVHDCRNSGQTVAAWCREHSMPVATYYRRQKLVWEQESRKLPEKVTGAQMIRAEERQLVPVNFEPVPYYGAPRADAVEAAQIILNTPSPSYVIQDVPGGEAPEYDALDMEILLRTRETARHILEDATYTVEERLVLLLLYTYQAQAELNGEEVAPDRDDDALLEHARRYARTCDPARMLEFFQNLEILTPEWSTRLDTPSPAVWEARHLTLARYFVDRYWLQAISDFDLVCRGKLAVISCIVIRMLGGNLIGTAQIFSKEIENSIENIEMLLDAAYENPSFTDMVLCGYLLQNT